MRAGVCCRLLALGWLGAGCGGGGGNTEEDAGDDQQVVCTGTASCSDGVFCNGAETCEGVGSPGADARGCVAATTPCLGTQTCDEEADECRTMCEVTSDSDGDGHDAVECDGDDCDDSDMMRFPGNLEVCDGAHDEDCDPTTFGETDGDTDTHISSACCNGETCGDDCNDALPAVFTGASEMCNGLDDDCDAPRTTASRWATTTRTATAMVRAT